MVNPLVSVVVPVYNVEKYLEKCLDSILNQTLENIEIICVNDGSPDGSQAILERYAKKDKRIRVVVQENGGQSNARNHGLRLATGEYIAFVDSDDFIDKNMFALLYARAKQEDCDIVIGDLLLYEHSTGETSTYREQALYLYLKNKVFSLSEQPELLKSIGVWDRIYRRSFLEKIHVTFPEGLVYEDHLYCIQTALFAQRIAVIPKHLYYYRKNAGQSITDREVQNDKFKLDFLIINDEIQKSLDETSATPDLRRIYLEYFIFNAIMHQQNATTYSFFKTFFNRMRGMLRDADYKIIAKMDYVPAVRYGAWLQENNYSACRKYFLLRRHFRRDGTHIFFRLNLGGKEIKIK